MAVKKYQMQEKISATEVLVIHPETTASQVLEETDKRFMTDAERTKLAGLSNYTHPTGFKDAPESALTGAKVISKIEVTSEGHVEGVTTRNLTPGNIGAEPTIASGSSGQYWDGTKTWKPMPTSLPADGGNADTVDGKHASDFILKTEKGEANGVATLDSTGKVPAAQLPSYVDDVIDLDVNVDITSIQVRFSRGTMLKTELEEQPADSVGELYYNTTYNELYRCTYAGDQHDYRSTWETIAVTSVFTKTNIYYVTKNNTVKLQNNVPTIITFETGKVYVSPDNKTYRYTGGKLAIIGTDLALGETAQTAYPGDKGKIAYDHSQSTGNPHGTTASDVGAEPAFSKNTAFNKNFETSASNIKMNGTASAGSSTKVARADHVHPTDTSREAAFTKNTAFNKNFETSASNIKMNGTASVGTSNNIPRADHVHPTDTTRAPIASPTFTGDPKAPTPATTDNDTSIATTAFVKNVVGAANNLYLPNSGITPGVYSVLQVNAKGIVVSGAQLIEIGAAGQSSPSSSLAIGGLFFKEV